MTAGTAAPPVTLRATRARDLDALHALDQACFEPDIAYTRGQLRDLLSRDHAIGLVAEIDGVLAGFAIGHRTGGRGHVVTLDVAGGRRRQGVGRILLRELLERLESAGARTVRLEVDLRNPGAIRFYERLGFRETRRLRGYYGHRLDGLEMVRETGD
ncbi:MAG TPA: GNAT family N-acetyltransferase [Thermoanaerobaculia bacterium]|jgi:ribosomal-protein-alanine N-acetyltransferase